MPYNPEERKLLRTFQRSSHHNHLIVGALTRKYPNLRQLTSQQLLTILQEVSNHVDPRFRPLIVPARLEDEPEILAELLAHYNALLPPPAAPKQEKEKKPEMGPLPKRSKGPTRPIIMPPRPPHTEEEEETEEPPDILADGSDESWHRAEALLKLPEPDAKKAVQPASLSGNPLSFDGFPPLYHQTLHASFKTGARNPKGANVITYFYARRGSQLYLVAWGHHVTGKDGAVSYKIVCSIHSKVRGDKIVSFPKKKK